MKQIIKNNRYFILPHIILCLIGIVSLLIVPKAEIHVFFNAFHSPFFDTFFKSITYLGNGMMYLMVLVFLFSQKKELLVSFILAVVVSNIVLVICKHFVFVDTCRPSKYFEMYESYKLYFVKGVKLHSFHSFPSGHTTTAFTVFFTLSLAVKKNGVKLFLFIVALLTGYSRIYLSQHFLIDVVVGSLLGIGSVLVAVKYSSVFLTLFRSWKQVVLSSNFYRLIIFPPFLTRKK